MPAASRRDEIEGCDGAAEQIALGGVAAEIHQIGELFLGFDALGQHFEIERLSQGDDGGDDFPVGAA